MSKTIQTIKLIAIFAVVATLQSCFKDEPLNAECDIETAFVEVATPTDIFFSETDAYITVASDVSNIAFTVRRTADITALAPRFTLTPGATISPENGSVHDFSAGPVTYTVTSEDRQWSRQYQVSFNPVVAFKDAEINIDFEHYELDPSTGKFYVWHNVQSDGSLGNDWATGNPGFRLSKALAPADEYPTVPLRDGYDGAGVMLTTSDTGAFGVMVNKRLAAGNLFLGTFDVSVALKDALQATCFGVPFEKKPIRLTGYYQYQPGAKFQDFYGKEVPGKTDQAAIYAVLFRNHDSQGNALVLHGDDVKTNPNIVALADLKDIPATSEWTTFNVDFDYKGEVDLDLLQERGYSLTIVFSSSTGGDTFEGAIGSQLKIDKVKLICEEEE